MSFQLLQDTPLIIDLASFARTTGWELVGGEAVHEACNDGFIAVLTTTFDPVAGESYTVAYQIKNYVSGNIRMSIGTTQGVLRSANGLYVETLVAGGVDPTIKFFATGALTLRTIDARSNFVNTANTKKNTIVFSEKSAKWTTFLAFTSDFGVSLFKDLFTFKGGRMYRHDPTLLPRNNVYGVQYKTIFQFVGNAGITEPKSYLGLSYESNQLMVTTSEGIETSLGQVSELIDQDFLKATLDDGVTQIDVYDQEGIYSSSFLRDMRNGGDINNGDELKGTYILVSLIQVSNEVLTLRNITIHSEPSKIGVR